MKRFAALLLIGALGLTGCATYPVQVTTLRQSATTASRPTYIIEEQTLTAAIQSRPAETALRCLRTAMAHRGFTEVGRREDAAIVLAFRYEAVPVGMNVRHVTRSADVSRPEPPMTVNRRSEPPPPSRDVFVLRQGEARYRISAWIDARDAANERPLWRVETSSIIGPNDRNAILPVMIAAAEPHLDPARSTTVEVAVGQASAEVKALRSGS